MFSYETLHLISKRCTLRKMIIVAVYCSRKYSFVELMKNKGYFPDGY